MVFESVVVDVLNRFLGDYVVNLDSSQLKLGIWGGQCCPYVYVYVCVRKQGCLTQLDVPFKVKAGHIEKLDLKIPWKNLYTQPVEAVLDGVYLLIVPIASIKYDAEKEEKQFLEAKQRELQRIEDAKQKVADQEKPKEEKQDTFVEKLITQVIKNLQVKVSNIHIRYEDDMTNPGCPLSFGVSLQNLSLQVCGLCWVIYSIHCLVRLDNLFAYWNVKSEMYYHRSYNEALGVLKHGVASQNVIPEGYDFVFRPISGRAKLRMNPRSDVDFSTAKIDLNVNLQDIAIEFNKPQYHSVMELLESVDMMSRNLPYRKFRPDVCVHDHASKWWKYVITGILEVNVKPGLHMWAWRRIRKHRQEVKRYKELYKSKITTKKPSEDVLRTTEEYEKTLDIFNITLARQQAEMEACKSGLKIYRPGAKDDDGNNKGWFGWMWGWSGQNPEQKAEPFPLLFAAIGYSETAVDPTLPKSYEAIILCVKLLSMSIQLREDKGKPELINVAITDLSTVLKQRPGAQALRLEAQIGTFEVTGTCQGKSLPCLLSSRNIVMENNVSLLSLMFETNPLDESADQRLRVESQPLEIIYDAITINSLADFFRPPQNVHLEQLTSATLTKLEEFRDKTSTGLLYVIETQKVLDLKINLMASYILVPQNGFYEPKSNLLILDLGSLKMSSKSRAKLPQLKIGQHSIEDIMSRAYESFDVQLCSMQLLYSKHYENWKEARKLKHSPQHILEPMELNVDFSRAMVVTDARMPKFKLYGQLPLLCLRISDQKLKGILELLDSIPKPESPPAPASSPKKVEYCSSIGLKLSYPGHELESEEEFYDAPTSPVAEMGMFDFSSGSLTRTDSMKRKKLTKQETLKNMTEFQMRFEIPEVSNLLMEQAEEPVLQMEILGLGTELNVRTFDMSANAFLKEISLKCPQYTDDEGKTVRIITTLDNTTDDLLTLEYVKADMNGPEFKTTYKNVEQLIKVNFSSLDVHLHTEALLNTMNFLTNLLPQSEKQETEKQVPDTEEEKKDELKKTMFVLPFNVNFWHIIKLNVLYTLSSLWISKLLLIPFPSGLDSEVIMRKKATEILAKLKNIVILDLNNNALYKKAVYITGKEVFSLRMLSYIDATEGTAYTDMNIVDSHITLTVGCIEVIFVNKFVSSILAFVNNFQAAKEALTEATVHAAEIAASGVKELAQHSYRLALDINLKAPVVIVPQSSTSSKVLVADLGLITVKNQFFIVTPKSRCNLPPVIDAMSVKLSELKLYRAVCEKDVLHPEVELLQPLNLDITIERNLAAAWYSEIPDIKITGHLKPMNVSVVNLFEFTGKIGRFHFLKLNEKVRTTVVTAALVETYAPVKVKTTLKLDFQFDSLTLNLFSSNNLQTRVNERDNALKLAEFKLGLISTAVKMSSDGAMNAIVKLANCTMDDKRQAVQKATPRMLEMKQGCEKNVMVDVCYKQGREGMVLDVIVRDIYLCASMEFLLTVAGIFLKASEQSSTAQKSIKQTATTTKETAPTQQMSKMEMNVVVKNPEIVFVADLTRADAPALVLTTQCELSIKNNPDMQHMAASVKDLHIKACPFLPDKRAGNVTTILQPCDLFFQSIQSGGDPQRIELSLKSLMLKVSPVIINTVITITSAISPSKEAVEEVTSPIPVNLWGKKDVKDLKLWFLEEAEKDANASSDPSKLVLTGESLKLSIESIIVTLEAGVGHRTLPMLLAKSSFSGDVKNWSTLINLHCQLELEVHYYNEVFGVWEPLLEPIEIERSDDFRPWSLEIKMKKKLRKQLTEMDGNEENYKIPEYITAINIFSKDHLNITLSKCGLLMLSNLGQAFAEAANKTADVFKKDQAPFVVKNCLGLPISVSLSDSFMPLNVESAAKKVNLNDGECLSMDYVRSKSQPDKFSAMTSLSSKQFYIQLTPLNHSTTEKIPLTKVGRSLYCVWHSDSGVERYIVCQVDTVEGAKRITIRSPLQIRNHFSIEFNVYEEGNLVGAAAPDDDFNIPLSSYRSSLCLKPSQEQGFERCEAISFEEIMKNDCQLLQKKCHSLPSSKDSLIIHIAPVKDILISSVCTDDKWDLPYVVHLWPSVVLRNLLPYQIAYLLEGFDNEPVPIDEGCSAQVHNAVVDHSRLKLQLLGYLDLNWKAKYQIQSKQQDIHFITFQSDSEMEKAELDIAVHVMYTTGQTILAIHSPYWMVNKTGRMLQYKADDVHRKHPANQKKPLLFSFKPKNFFQNNKVQLMITDSELSEPFSMDTVGSHGAVKCKSKSMEYQVGVTIYASSFNVTRIVTFTPFYMIANRSDYKLDVIEDGGEKWITVGSEQCVPFWPESSNNKLTVQVQDSQTPSKKINFNKQDNATLLRLDDKLGALLADVTLREHSTVVTFSNYHKGAAPFLLINHTNSETIEFFQSSQNGYKDTLPPGKAVLFAWEDPTSQRELTWKCGPFNGVLETCVVYVVSFLEGLQRIVLFTEDESVFQVTYDSEKAELAEQEITISLSNVGISLVNNYSKQEVSYIGITSSDVVWENKKKSRWRPLSVKQTEKLEEAFKEYTESVPTENKIVELDPNIQVCLTPTFSNMKIVQSSTSVRRSFLPALKLEYSASAHQTSIRVQVYRIQIQNQIPGAIFPFVFYPIKPPKSVTLDSGLFWQCWIFVDRSYVFIAFFLYFKVLIQEMDLRIDLGFLYALADLFTQSGDVPKDQVELFKKDVESLQTELSAVSSTDTSQVSLYEYFHISPIKLHLSFSLSTGGEDGNKEQREKELIPVQSVNLLLKSIGATLTDVQDLVIQFHTTQELQWEVIRHYSKQAIKQMYVLVLGLDVLGNPFGFFRDLSEGVEAFFYEPYQGAIQGPEEFVEGMALGVKALVGGAVGGLAGAASRITSAMAKGVAAITMDEDYQQKRREAMNKQPSGIKEGITRGGKGLVSGFVSGITGIVTKPIKGAQKEGAAGFFKGVGKGLVGAVTRPTGGIIDMASSTFQGIKRATDSSDEVESLRPPRFFHEDGVIRPYRLREGSGRQMLQGIENGRFAKCKYYAHAMINNTDLLMVMKSGVLFVTKGTFGQLTCEWQYSFDEFTKEPFIVDGRRLRIEAKERVKSVFHAKEYGKIINFRTQEDAKWILSKLEEVRESLSKS
uniref:Vacuolar protein sorting 13 homolog A n=1 Tax=Leptobrachium leishanense TaxID=445787 RepID=A0A8C5MNH3_9ANUR